MARLPPLTDLDELDRLREQPAVLDAAIASICARHDLRGQFVSCPVGSAIVYLSDELCIKLHPPLAAFVDSCAAEIATLELIAGRVAIATPEIVASDQLDGWPYFVATRLPGQPIDELWDQLDSAQRSSLARELGAGVASLHRIPVDAARGLGPAWDELRSTQRERCLQRERDRGLAEDRLAELAAYLVELDALPAPPSAPALLHTELGPGHVLVHDGRISGVIDFGEPMVGDPEYDLAPVGMFVTRGDRAAFRAFCEAYGLTDGDLADPQRPARLLGHALLHRYGSLAWYLHRLRPPALPLSQLADHWFGV